MNTYYEKLAAALLEKNDMLTMLEARTWVELLWEDFESTYAKAGRKYKGKDATERVVLEWIETYGSQLHLFPSDHPKYKDILNSSDYLLH